MSAVAVVYDPDVFEGLDINQRCSWLDTNGVTHRILDMLVTERLSAAAELEAMASRVAGGSDMVCQSPLYLALLAVNGGDRP